MKPQYERSHPLVGGIGTGIVLSMGGVGLAEVLSSAPKHTAVQVLVMVGFAVGGVLQYVGLTPRRTRSEAPQ
jgi:hypothetical protein